jgi:curved DNA-binding protein CbpA
MDAFAELGMPRSAAIDEDELKRRFDALSRERHPDSGGDTNAFARLTEARVILSSWSRRLRHLLELESPGTRLEGAISPTLMTLFGEIGPALQASRELLDRKSAATSELGRALLASEEMRARESLEPLAAQLNFEQQAGARAATTWTGDPTALASMAREAAFLEKWQAQIRAVLRELGT